MFESKSKIEMWANCGDDYYLGQNGEKKDYEMAVYFYEKAAKKKHPHATYMLGLCYELGKGVKKDSEYAETLFENAASYGDADAKKRLNGVTQTSTPAPVDEIDFQAPKRPDLLAGDTGEIPVITDKMLQNVTLEEKKQEQAELAANEAKARRKQAELDRIDNMLNKKSVEQAERTANEQKAQRRQAALERAGNMLQSKDMLAKGMAFLNSKQYGEAIDCLRKAATAGDTDAMMKLYHFFHSNEYIGKIDMKHHEAYGEARNWLFEAAKRDVPEAKKILFDESVGRITDMEANAKAAEKKAREEERKQREEKRKQSSTSPKSDHYAGAAAAAASEQKASEERRRLHENSQKPYK